MMIIEPIFEIGETVFSKTDPDQYERMVTGYTIRKTGIVYLVTFIDSEKQFEEFELTKEKVYK